MILRLVCLPHGQSLQGAGRWIHYIPVKHTCGNELQQVEACLGMPTPTLLFDDQQERSRAAQVIRGRY